jgi:hypothetical protein
MEKTETELYIFLEYVSGGSISQAYIYMPIYIYYMYVYINV